MINRLGFVNLQEGKTLTLRHCLKKLLNVKVCGTFLQVSWGGGFFFFTFEFFSFVVIHSSVFHRFHKVSVSSPCLCRVHRGAHLNDSSLSVVLTHTCASRWRLHRWSHFASCTLFTSQTHIYMVSVQNAESLYKSFSEELGRSWIINDGVNGVWDFKREGEQRAIQHNITRPLEIT